MKTITEHNFDAVLVGASAGGVEALNHIFQALPGDIKIPIIVVIHLPSESKFSSLAYHPTPNNILKEAEDKELFQAGTIYFSPPNYHLLIEKDSRFTLYFDEPVRFARPSIVVLFESAADALASRMLCVLLTGSNDDGAMGLLNARQNGALTVVQDPKTAYASEMPSAAIAIQAAEMVLSIQEIAQLVSQITALRPVKTENSKEAKVVET